MLLRNLYVENKNIFGFYLTHSGLNTWNAIIREHRAIATGQGVNRELNESLPSEERQVEYIAAFESVNYPGNPLKLGESGDSVRIMQQYLGMLATTYQIPSIQADGNFGENTESCVRVFQQLVGLSADGIIGQDTWKAISDSYWNLANRDALISAMGRVITANFIANW